MANGRLRGAGTPRYAVHHPLQHAQIVAKARPQELARRILAPASVSQFMVYSVEYCNGTSKGGTPYIAIRFSFSRNLMGAFLTIFLPYTVCIIIGYTTVFYNSFEVSAGTNLTLLLVLVTL